MRLLSLRKKTTGKQTVAVFDIASATVGCSIIRVKKGQKPQVYFTTRVPIKFQTHFRYDRFVQEMLKSFDTASDEAKQFFARSPSLHRIDRVDCVLSSAWYISKTHLLAFHRETPFTVSSAFVQKMIKRTEDHVEREGSPARKRKHIDDLSIIEKSLLSIALNGYRTAKPFGKQASTIDIALYISFLSSSIHKQLTEAIHKQFIDTEVGFHSHVLSAYTTVRDHYAAQDNFLLLDIGGEVSEISLIRDDVLEESVSIPIGVNTIARSVNKKRGSGVEEGRSIMRMVGDKESALDTESKEYTLLHTAGMEWKDCLMQALRKMDSAELYPRNIFVTAPQDSALWFKSLVEAPAENTNDDETGDLSVTVVSSQLLHEQLSFSKGVTSDPQLALHSLHISRIL